jgi:hypothetical protein
MRRMIKAAFVAGALSVPAAFAAEPPAIGPYHGVFIAGGIGLKKMVLTEQALLDANAASTLIAWFRADGTLPNQTLIAGFGHLTDGHARYFAVHAGKLCLWQGADGELASTAEVKAGVWHLAAASSDGHVVRLFLDGDEVAHGAAGTGPAQPVIGMAPESQPWSAARHFAGKVAHLSVIGRPLDSQALRAMFRAPPDWATIPFEEGSKTWPVQTKGQPGMLAPQDAWTLPQSKAPFSKPVAKPVVDGPPLVTDGPDRWVLAHGWRLVEAPRLSGSPQTVSAPGFDAGDWWAATVPGTVLTTLIDRGVYPDPDYGLDNLAIPESLARQDYWYRIEFRGPPQAGARHLALTFKGINYAAEVWLNGEPLGKIKGAFIRGRFDVTGKIHPNQANALAVRIAPPPHPGIPHEQSMSAGPGPNGGMQVLDGPTFIASEGWDWIPGIRDRNSGIWQEVTLAATGPVVLGDAQVVTTLPLPDTSQADITITVPLANQTAQAVVGRLIASFDDVHIETSLTVAPGQSEVRLAPSEFAQLHVTHPKLWWPNGYGAPALHTLHLSFVEGESVSDSKELRFGIRDVSYELSALDPGGHLRRVELDPAHDKGAAVIDGTHEGIREVPGGWAVSLRQAALSSPAVRGIDDTPLSPFLVIKVNGVRIAARGGSWGMDDSRKRVARERMEPFFRLHRNANVNIVRNWQGQSTEDVFYDLADEYGMLVWNDFWAATQDSNLEPQDFDLFLKNARDVILRYRSHPSIVIWVGRNEGVPPPLLNERLAELVREADGTRYYSGNSRSVNLWGSGPYRYQPPELYFTTLSRGFAVEVGTPSFPTIESFRAFVPEADQWPISDVWSYHDWHFGAGGDVASFLATIINQFGAAANLEDFERKAQMLNYVSYRAIFEGLNAGLWTQTSGRMLWMTQPAWPSTHWQIYSSDYDTAAAYYAVQKACEPVHVQMNLPDDRIVVANTTTTPFSRLAVHAEVFSLANHKMADRQMTIDAPADSVTPAFALDLAPALVAESVVLVRLTLADEGGKTLSRNFYWRSATDAALHKLNTLAPQTIGLSATASPRGDEVQVAVVVTNAGNQPALHNKLTLLKADGTRILPAYASDNYLSLMPGESRDVTFLYPAKAGSGQARVAVRGWNAVAHSVAVNEGP